MSQGTGAPSTNHTTAFGNKRLNDSANIYDVTNPNASTLSLQPLVTPQHVLTGGPNYPFNTQGDDINFFIAEQLAFLARRAHYTSYPVHASCCGIFAQTLAAISKGGTVNSYAASLYEPTAAKRLNGGSGVFVRAVCATVGGNDAAIYNAGYQSAFAAFAAQYDTDLRALTGQVGTIPCFASQQIAVPAFGEGPDLIAPAQLGVALASGGTIVCPCPRYPYPTLAGDHGHLSDYSGMGYKYAQAIWEHCELGVPWLPLYCTGASRSNLTVTFTFNVRRPPLRWAAQNDNDDHTATAPHQVAGGGIAPVVVWALGNGFEASDTYMTPTSATNTSPIVVGYGVSIPGTITNGSMVYFDGIFGNSAANGAWYVHVLDSQHLQLYKDAALTVPVVGNGVASFSGPATRSFACIPITGATIVGNTVQVILGRTPAADGKAGYASTPDGYTYALFVGGFPSGCCGLLRDSDPFIDLQLRPQYNWACKFLLPVS